MPGPRPAQMTDEERRYHVEQDRLQREIAELEAELEEHGRTFYKPSKKQLEFHAAGKSKRERMLFGANRSGKTKAGAHEAAYHATGDYPDWWPGRTFPEATIGWVAGVSSELTRDVCQRYLFGDPSSLPASMGTGLIPKDRIVDFRMGRGLANVLDTVTIRHRYGGISTIKFKSYDQGRARFQSAKCNWAWPDEEAPYEIYKEILTRTNDGGQRPGELGIVFMTFTPLNGLTDTVKRFYPTPTDPNTMAMIVMSLDDVEHFTEAQKRAIEATYDSAERRARTQGLPYLGSGLVYDIDPDLWICKPFPLMRDHFRIIGLDPGTGNHPYAFGHCAIDRNNPDAPIFYVTDVRQVVNEREATAYQIIREMGGSHPAYIPVAWPHDLGKHDRDSGKQLAQKYREDAGLSMLPLHATHPSGGIGIEAGVREIREAKASGRFKVFETCVTYREQALSYHRVDGVINQSNDHVLDAVRKAWMMQRFAAQPADSATMEAILGARTQGADYDPHADAEMWDSGDSLGGEW